MSKPRGHMVARALVTSLEAPGKNPGPGRKGSTPGRTWEAAVRLAGPGPTTGRAKAAPSNVAELKTTATLARRNKCSL